ncbi:hypothetical protein M422DRAFT_269817 [Sphaerobolus stellatus SS14]|uniref:Unplaced genomic scaffold SPHSTscaffold_221, whole genome shotgun sequence n=1 Tax=Sphaerobolus stellatus (strain SS14) TaxID=990650 RepID=A0A0C9U3T0_SPHS4|nr:hypothetical protein M422DRAFT_269817 [Sphaerobolus stellatus SS14]
MEKGHAHYGIDTNNVIESWHSNLKKHYIGKGNCRQWVDHLIHLLSQCIVPDFYWAHIQSGLGLQGCNLCKAELDTKQCADLLSFEDASNSVMQIHDSTLNVKSFTNEGVFYEVKLEDEKIISCACPAFSLTQLTCKHMFLAVHVTNFGIHLPHAIIPAKRSLEIDREDTLQYWHPHKRCLIAKAHEGLSAIVEAHYWGNGDTDEGADNLSKESLTRFVSNIQSLWHEGRDIMPFQPDNAIQ